MFLSRISQRLIADTKGTRRVLPGHVVSDTNGVGPLEIGVEVDLDDTEGDGGAELVDRGAGAAVEDEEDGLVILGSKFLADETLVLSKELGVELDVAWLINTVDVCYSLLAKRRRKILGNISKL